MKRNLVTAFGAIAGSQIAIMLVGVAFSPILIRLLGTGTYGEYAALIAIFDMFMILIGAGINGGVRKYIAEDRDDENWKSYVFAYYFRIAVGLALLGGGALVLAAEYGIVDMFLDAKYTPYFYMLAVLAIAAQLREYARRTLMGLKLEYIGGPLNVLFRFSNVIIAIVLVLLGFSIAGVILGLIIASMLVFFLSFVVVSRHISLSKIFRRTPPEFPRKKLLFFNQNTVIYMFLLVSLYKVDLIMMGALSSSQQTGYYRIALVVAEFLWVLPRSLQSLMIQSTSDLWAKGRTDVIEEIASRSVRYILLLTLLLAVGLASLAHIFVPLLYEASRSPAVKPLYVLLIGTVGFAVARPLLTINQAKGDMTIPILATLFAAVLNLVLNYLLIPRYGMMGAAVSTSVGYGSLPIFQAWGARYLGYSPFKNARLGRIAATAILSGSVIGMLSMLLGETTIADLGLHIWIITDFPLAMVIVPPAGFLLYSLIAIATGAVDLGEIFEILVKVPGPIGSISRPLAESFDASDQFGTEQSQISALKLIVALAAVIIVVSGAVIATGFPLFAMTPFGSDDDGVFGAIIDPGPPAQTPAGGGNSTPAYEVTVQEPRTTTQTETSTQTTTQTTSEVNTPPTPPTPPNGTTTTETPSTGTDGTPTTQTTQSTTETTTQTNQTTSETTTQTTAETTTQTTQTNETTTSNGTIDLPLGL